MYCIKCGVKLADTESACPLCGTAVFHPEISPAAAQPLYPKEKLPAQASNSTAWNGVVLILFLIPLFVCLCADINPNGRVEWFGYVAGALLVTYVAFALPGWFRTPNPVVFVPCDFAAVAAYLLYIDLATDGGWFLPFALPIVLGAALIACTAVTLFRTLRRGRLYVAGGTLMAAGAFLLPIELLIRRNFGVPFTGWSLYPLVVSLLVGGLLIYLAVNRSARETLERKLFF